MIDNDLYLYVIPCLDLTYLNKDKSSGHLAALIERLDLSPGKSLEFHVSDAVHCLNKPQEFDQVTGPDQDSPHQHV